MMHAAVRDIVSVLGQLARARTPRSSPPAVGRWLRRRRGGRAEAVVRILPPPPARPTGPFAARPSWGAAPRAPVPAVESVYAHAGAEPCLEEVLRDPIVQLVMRADRLEPATVRRALLAAAAGRRRPRA